MTEQEMNPMEEQAAPQEEVQTEAPEQEPQEQEAQGAPHAEEYLALAQRVQADFDNYRRRNESARAEAYAEGQRMVLTAMLAVLDNLERALAAQALEGDALRVGVEMTHKQMLGVYEKLGVTVIDRLGEAFDPNLEEAVLQGTADEGEPGTVCMVLQKGYMMGSHVLRHAMVKVVAD